MTPSEVDTAVKAMLSVRALQSTEAAALLSVSALEAGAAYAQVDDLLALESGLPRGIFFCHHVTGPRGHLGHLGNLYAWPGTLVPEAVSGDRHAAAVVMLADYLESEGRPVPPDVAALAAQLLLDGTVWRP